MKLTDEEVICKWMEVPYLHYHTLWWRARWHGPGDIRYGPQPLTLDLLHLVEQRLTVADWRHYCAILWQYTDAPTANAIEDLILRHRRTLIHLSTEQKITALAAVLRSASPRGPGAGEERDG